MMTQLEFLQAGSSLFLDMITYAAPLAITVALVVIIVNIAIKFITGGRL